jgi:hypothetical protein
VGGSIEERLVKEFVVVGIHFQNWMLTAGIIALLGLLFVAVTADFRDWD